MVRWKEFVSRDCLHHHCNSLYDHLNNTTDNTSLLQQMVSTAVYCTYMYMKPGLCQVLCCLMFSLLFKFLV